MNRDIRDIFRMDFKELFRLFAVTSELREQRSGNKVALCVIANAKSGHCPQDCAFCSQSAVSRAKIPKYGLLSVEELTRAARYAHESDAYCFSIVTSGRSIRGRAEQKSILAAVEAIRGAVPVNICASLGIVQATFLEELKEAGLYRYHHNLEASESFFPRVCNSHSFRERVRTVETAKAAGLKVCSGGIFGMGESVQDRMDLAMSLKRLEADSVPLNFLQPIAGTPLEHRPPLRPRECLQVITAFRLVFPNRPIIICGGRVPGLRSLGPLMFAAGADGLMTGDYLTTSGRAPARDIEMLADLNLSPKLPGR